MSFHIDLEKKKNPQGLVWAFDVYYCSKDWCFLKEISMDLIFTKFYLARKN